MFWKAAAGERKREGERFSCQVGSTSTAQRGRSCGRRLTLLGEVAGLTVVEVLVEVSAMRPLQAGAETKV